MITEIQLEQLEDEILDISSADILSLNDQDKNSNFKHYINFIDDFLKRHDIVHIQANAFKLAILKHTLLDYTYMLDGMKIWHSMLEALDQMKQTETDANIIKQEEENLNSLYTATHNLYSQITINFSLNFNQQYQFFQQLKDEALKEIYLLDNALLPQTNNEQTKAIAEDLIHIGELDIETSRETKESSISNFYEYCANCADIYFQEVENSDNLKSEVMDDIVDLVINNGIYANLIDNIKQQNNQNIARFSLIAAYGIANAFNQA